ncbi:MAG TPA: ASKHA domain-containing protein [Thermodesulfobacteriota bacterium]|nr:ASKHA domain-containing protein [Thermodesulfobacteriota bacterium]
MPKHTITFHPSGRKISVDSETDLLQAAMEAGIHINASCGGSATCGKCKVKILKGSADTPKHPKLSQWEYVQGYRLACMTSVRDNIEVEIPLESQVDKSVLKLKGNREVHKYLLSPQDIYQLVKGWDVDPAVFKRYVQLTPPTLKDNMSDLTRLLNGLTHQHGIERVSADFRMMMKLSRILRESDWKVTVTLVLTRKGYKLVNVESGDNTRRNYSIVIDIGTTTVSGQLLNLNECVVVGCPDGQCDGTTLFALAEASDYNAQISYGEDVITRIVYSQKPGGLKKLQEVVVSTINGIIHELLKMSQIDQSLISHLVIAGNTTMTQLLLGLNPKYIREEPYVPTANFIPPVRAIHFGIDIGDHVHIYTFPMVASYVGGDIVAGILGSGISQRETLTLYMDIGTNGEIVLGNKDWLASDSCSAGPAFEGAGIKFGMRATRGAIEEVSINHRTYEPMIVTIGRAKPIGICGSGLIDTVAELLEIGAIDQNGKFRMDLPTDRIRKGFDGSEYVLARKEETQIKEDIVLTEIDIENLIRTKAALYAGCNVLLESVGLGFKDLQQVVIAGGFGRHLDLEKAIFIGLLPELDIDRFIFVGNGSLLGARLLSFSKDLLKETERIALMMTNLELSNHPTFMNEFIAANFLPHTDTSAFPQTMGRLHQMRQGYRSENRSEAQP